MIRAGLQYYRKQKTDCCIGCFSPFLYRLLLISAVPSVRHQFACSRRSDYHSSSSPTCSIHPFFQKKHRAEHGHDRFQISKYCYRMNRETAHTAEIEYICDACVQNAEQDDYQKRTQIGKKVSRPVFYQNDRQYGRRRDSQLKGGFIQ